MKIDGTITVYYCSGGEYLLVPEQKVDIPIGARVTVEWDDPNIHKCEKSEQQGKKIWRGKNGVWWATDTTCGYRTNAGVTEIDVIYCPCCGMRLGG